MHIAVEGIDGSGKSTLAKLISKEFGLEYIEKPMHYLMGENRISKYKEMVTTLNKNQSQLVKSLFYACGNAYVVKNYSNIVTDRHILSNYYHNSDEENKKLFQFLIEILGKPTFTFLLYTENSIREKRMRKRDSEDTDLDEVHLFNNEEFLKMKKFLEDNNFRYAVIDNSSLNQEELLETAKNILVKEEIIGIKSIF